MPLWIMIAIILIWIGWTILEIHTAIVVATDRRAQYTTNGKRWTYAYIIITIIWWCWFFFH